MKHIKSIIIILLLCSILAYAVHDHNKTADKSVPEKNDLKLWMVNEAMSNVLNHHRNQPPIPQQPVPQSGLNEQMAKLQQYEVLSTEEDKAKFDK